MALREGLNAISVLSYVCGMRYKYLGLFTISLILPGLPALG